MHRHAAAIDVEALDRRLLLAATPSLVKDVNTGTLGSYYHDFVDVGGTLFFAASEDFGGHDDLYKSDGTPAGTVKVKDFGVPGSAFYTELGSLTAFNGRLYFRAPDPGGANLELWTSDGTDAGTYRVKDINPGVDASSPYGMVAFDGALYFSAQTADAGRELWKTDGTEAGTVMVKETTPGTSWGDSAILGVLGGKLYFTGIDPDHGRELWETDGTGAGTRLVVDLTEGVFSTPFTGGAFAAGNYLYFFTENPNEYKDLWRTDGTAAGTVPLRSGFVGGSDAAPYAFADAGGTFLFVGDDGENGWELWRSDGTADGTRMLKDIAPGTGSSYPTPPALLNGQYYFGASDGVNDAELWRTDGTAAGTVRAVDILPGPLGSSPAPLLNVGGTLYFPAFSSPSPFGGDRELWKSDGTPAGTSRVADVAPGPIGSEPESVTAAGGHLFFVASAGDGDRELWASDGTAAGTVRVADVTTTPAGSYPVNFVAAGQRLFFVAGLDPSFKQLWTSDGTDAGTRRVSNLLVGNYPTGVAVGDTFIFSAYDPVTGWELWRTDGTDAGTALVKDTLPGSNDSRQSDLFDFNGTLLFVNGDGTLWKTDGTAAGTVRVSDAVRAHAPFAVSHGVAYFAGNDPQEPFGSNGTLWKTDGTPGGTAAVGGPSPDLLVAAADGTLYFRADDGVNGNELWKSDGTAAGTVMVKDIFPVTFGNSRSSYPFFLTPFGDGVLFFAQSDDTLVRRLWKSDGTANGTVQIGPNLWHGGSEAVSGGVFYFTTYDGGLWRSDGSTASLVKAFTAGVAPDALTDVNGTLYFRARTQEAGYELWKSNGTEAGTVPVDDVVPGVGDFYPDHLTVVNGTTLMFAGDTPETGIELWKLALPGVAGRHVFHNGSAADGNDPAADGRDDAAIATGTAALRPGQSASFANVTGSGRGITGVMVDVSALPDGAGPTAADFDVRVGGGGSTWSAGPAPRVSVRRGAGVGGTDRVTLLFDPNTVRNTWLKVTVQPGARTGLSQPDVFYFGSLVGDTGGAGAPTVDAADVVRARRNLGRTDAGSKSRYDFNGDGTINARDLAIVLDAYRRRLALPSGVAAPPPPPPAPAAAPTPGAERRPARRSALITGSVLTE